MKANELRIGNLIEDAGKWCEVISIVKDKVEVQFIDNGYTLVIPAERANPIPLKPETLEKSGFVWDDNGYMIIDLQHCRMKLGFYAGMYDKMTLFQGVQPFDSGKYMLMHFGQNSPRYLHQLQNLYYALTGTELTIVSQ